MNLEHHIRTAQNRGTHPSLSHLICVRHCLRLRPPWSSPPPRSTSACPPPAPPQIDLRSPRSVVASSPLPHSSKLFDFKEDSWLDLVLESGDSAARVSLTGSKRGMRWNESSFDGVIE
jgi:hypothetical protein